MNYYEIVYIVHPALQAGHLDDIVAQINKKIEQLNGKILYQDNWGKKKLSYLIQKQKYGTYIFLQCMIDGSNINEISTEFELNTNILRHLVTVINKDQILESKNLDDQHEKKSESEKVQNNESKLKNDNVAPDQTTEDSKSSDVEDGGDSDQTTEDPKSSDVEDGGDSDQTTEDPKSSDVEDGGDSDQTTEASKSSDAEDHNETIDDKELKETGE